MEFEKEFKSFVCERLEANSGLDNRSPEYQKRHNEAATASKQLMETFTEEHKKIFNEYEQASATLAARDEENAYLRGLSDGVKLAKLFDSV